MAAADTDLIILDGCTFFYSAQNGDVAERDPEGLFYQDVRHLTYWHVRVNDDEVKPLSSRRVDYFSARVAGTGAAPVLVRRDRFVSEGVHEDVVLENLSHNPQRVRLEVAYSADFADVMEAQQGGSGEGRSWQETAARSVTLWREREGYRRGTVVTFNRRGWVTKKHATFDVSLGPRETWKLCIDITPIVDGKRKPPLLRCDAFHDHAPKTAQSLDEWLDDTPYLETEDRSSIRTR